MAVQESTGGTRERIKTVALELFTEQGYEKTSLREIAERLDVTKAALYYHFKSKDEIVNSFVEDHLDRLDDLVAWAEAQPATLTTRRGIISRYADTMLAGRQPSVMRFFEQNQTALRSLAAGQRIREQMYQLADLLCGGATSPEAQLRALLALFSVHSSWFGVRAPGLTDQERKEVALKVADELIAAIDPRPTDDLRWPQPRTQAGSESRSPHRSTSAAGDQSSSGARMNPRR